MIPKKTFCRTAWLLVLTTVLCPIVAMGDHVLVIGKNGKYSLLEEDAAGNTILHPITTIIDRSKPGPIVVPPGPVIPPGPVVPPAPDSRNLTSVVRTATAAVPAYEKKVEHCRTVAFVLGYLSPSVARVPNVADSRRVIRQAFDAAVGSDSAKWNTFWVTVDAKLDSMALTPATFSTALGDLAAGVSADLPASAEDNYADVVGRDTYGLDIDKIKEIMTWLLPLILQLWQLFAK